MKELYLAGGSYYDIQEVFSRVTGVSDTIAGLAEGDAAFGGAVECVKVTYDPKQVDLTGLMKIFFNVVDPYVQTEPRYRTGIYYSSSEDLPQLEYFYRFMQLRGAEPLAALGNLVMNDSVTPRRETRPLLTQLARIQIFEPAPPEKQHYLRAHPEADRNIDFDALAKAGLIN